MKKTISLTLVPLLVLASGCSTRVSSNHGHYHGHQSHVSVGVHGRSSGAGVIGALIVGGIVGAMINESEHQREERLRTEQLEQQRSVPENGEQDELVNGYELSGTATTANRKSTDGGKSDYEITKSTQEDAVNWYQVGKDGNCYLMTVANGITDIVAAVPNNKCRN